MNVHDRARLLAERLGLRHCPRVWVVPAPISPLLWALVGEPRLLVPASLLERLTEEQWDTLLAHELAHLRRRDHWVRILELACLGLYWWHPAVWWARCRLREVEEQCCDAWVVWALPGAVETYATAPVEAVTYLSVRPIRFALGGQRYRCHASLETEVEHDHARDNSAVAFIGWLLGRAGPGSHLAAVVPYLGTERTTFR